MALLKNPNYLPVPNWYCPKIPAEFTGAIQPVVYIAGLDIESNPVHRGIWEMVNLKPASKEFQPTYVNVSLNFRFPVKKEKEPIEAYSPLGLIKSNWLDKHLHKIPSVVVACFYIDWSDQYWSDRKTECANKIKELKAELAPHGTQILVMLIKTQDAKEDNFSTDRASSLCAAADILPKSLFILAQTHIERLQPCITRLELGMKEASKAYYTARVRRVKNMKERTNNQILLARYSFKTGVFQEIRRDYISALAAYMLAQDTLRSIRLQDFYAQQIKSVASWANYRICRLHLMKQEYVEASNHYDRHIRHFQRNVGNPNLEFEYHAYLQQQYSYFGELLRHYYTSGRSALDPTTYFLLAVNHSVKREEKMKALVQSLRRVDVSEVNPEFVVDCVVNYVGQRPWRNDSGEFVHEASTEQEGIAGVLLLNYIEQHHDHSTDRINHYGIASDFCRDLQRTRTRCELMMMMGHEFLNKKEFHRCIILMTHVLKEFGRDKLTELLFVVAETGLKAAWHDADVTAYLSFLIFLLKKDFATKLGDTRRLSLWSAFVTAVNKNIPCSLDNDNALVPKEDVWKATLEKPLVAYVVVHKEPVLDAAFFFVNETFRAGARAEVRVVLKNFSEFSIDIQKVGVVIIIGDYNTENDVKLALKPGESHELSLFFPLMVRDTGKIIQIQMGYVDIGKPDVSVLLHYSALIESNPYLWNDGKKDVKKQIIAKIDPMLPLLTPKVEFEFYPVLTNSVHKVDVTWTNTDVHKYTKLNLMCRLECPELEDLYVTTQSNNVNAKLRNMGVTVDLDELAAGESKQVSLYLNSRKPRADIQITTKAKYIDGLGQIVTNDSVEPIEVIDPYSVSWEFWNSQCDKVPDVSINEPFMTRFIIKNVSHQTLQLQKVEFKLASNAFEETGRTFNLPHFIKLRTKETYDFVCSYHIQFPTQLPFGDLSISWVKYRNQGHEYAPMLTTFPVNAIPISRCNIFVETVVCGKGIGELKKPMPIKYSVTNCTEKVMDLCVSLESSDSFMNAGSKKINLKLTSGGTANFQYVLFPLKTGLLLTPRLVFDHANAGGDNRVAPIVQKNVVKHIFVARAERGVEINGTSIQST